jgi:hypothetical protein
LGGGEDPGVETHWMGRNWSERRVRL